jgi:multidrug efflux pump subunit AcrB
VGLIAGGQLEFIFLESDDAETVTIELQMPVGTSLEETDRVTRRLETAVREQDEVRSFFTIVGQVSR